MKRFDSNFHPAMQAHSAATLRVPPITQAMVQELSQPMVQELFKQTKDEDLPRDFNLPEDTLLDD